jgi:SOS-response transcriptional repressor LexA
VKYYHPEGERIRFESANPAYAPIIVAKREWRSVNLLGVVIGVYRKLT